MESAETGIESGLTTTGKTHQHDSLGIHARMFGQKFKSAIDVEDEIETSKQSLVRTHLCEPAAGKAVERKCRNTHSVKFSRPHLDVGTHAARAMLKHDERQPARAGCYSQ